MGPSWAVNRLRCKEERWPRPGEEEEVCFPWLDGHQTQTPLSLPHRGHRLLFGTSSPFLCLYLLWRWLRTQPWLPAGPEAEVTSLLERTLGMEKYSQPPSSSPSHIKGFLCVSLDTETLLNVRTGGNLRIIEFWRWNVQVQIRALLLGSCVTFEERPSLSGPQFIAPSETGSNSPASENLQVKHVRQSIA